MTSGYLNPCLHPVYILSCDLATFRKRLSKHPQRVGVSPIARLLYDHFTTYPLVCMRVQIGNSPWRNNYQPPLRESSCVGFKMASMPMVTSLFCATQ